MQDLDDQALLREYADHGSEAAFATLVARHVNKVYSVAWRHTGNVHQAEEITQAVFVILAGKSRRLGDRVILEGWLYQTARLTALAFIRGETRRARREQEARLQTLINENEAEVWTQIAPLLDAAMAGLNETDRHAVVLRFFYGQSMKEVGDALGGSEGAARLRLHRAVEKLRRYFLQRGVTSTAETIAGAISANCVQAAPAALVKSVTAAALTKGAAAGGSTLTLIKGALKLMAWTKAKTAIVVGVGVLLAAGTTTVTVNEIEKPRTYPWQVPQYDRRVLDQAPPQVRILPAKYPTAISGSGTRRGKIMGLAEPAVEVVKNAYGFYQPDTRVVLADDLPVGGYDFIATLPSGNMEALQREVKRKFGVIAKRETIETNVLLLKVRRSAAPGLRRSTKRAGSAGGTRGTIEGVNSPLFNLTVPIELYFNLPVLDRTGLTNRFDFDLEWEDGHGSQPHNFENLKQALLDQLGLELAPSREPIEMLVIEPAKH